VDESQRIDCFAARMNWGGGVVETVVVAHGLWMPGWETVVLRRRLVAAGFAPQLFRYRTVNETLRGNSERLAGYVANVPGSVVHFLGYSLGGVVTLEMFDTHPPERPGRIVCLGSPLRGSASAGKLASLPGGRGLVGKSMLDLYYRGGLRSWSGQRDLGIVAGDLAVGLGRVLGALEGANDGTVAVDETRLAGAADHIVLPVSHTSMLFARPVADQACHFLRHGRFERLAL
jgi:pimeloyl-ACP methyl ester carboxylesterase